MYNVDECARVRRGDYCKVVCPEGYSGSPANFLCPKMSQDPRQVPEPVNGWPDCKRTATESVALWGGIAGLILSIVGALSVFFCPGGVRDCLVKRSREREESMPEASEA